MYNIIVLTRLNAFTHGNLGTGRKERDKEGEGRGEWHLGLARASLL